VLGELGRGELFGEMALFEDDVRSATVVATTRTRLGRIERADFEDLVEEVPGIALAVCRVLSRRVRALNLRPR
jgi:CRP-like cAMP-binding protein